MAATEGVVLLLGGGCLLSVASAFALSRYAERSMSWSSFSAAVLGFTLAFSIVGLVPYDVWCSLMLHEQSKRQSNVKAPSHLLVRDSWAAIYWTTTVLCYLLIPFLIEFEAAGEFTFGARLRKSLRNNAVWYLAYAILGVCGAVWLVYHGMQFRDLGAWCIAASNAWGLILLTILMGFGLVALPRQLWSLGCPSGQLKVLYPQALTKEEAKISAQYELQCRIAEAEREVGTQDASLTEQDATLKLAYQSLESMLEESKALQQDIESQSGFNSTGQGCAFEGVGSNPEPRLMGLRTAPPAGGAGSITSGDAAAALARLVKLHSQLKAARLDAQRCACRFEDLVKRCLLYEELEAGDERALSSITLLNDGPSDGCCARLRYGLRAGWRRAEAIWIRRLRSRVYRASGYVCALLSSIIVLGQLTMLSPKFNLSLLSMLFLDDHGAVLTQALCALPLSYMACTAYWSVFRLKIAGWYGLYSNHNTDAGSLLWCSYSLARLALPLCYHFLLLVDRPPHFKTSFQEFMGQMVLVPILGHRLNQVFPYLVAFVVFCNVTKVYSRVVHCLGLSLLAFEWSPNLESDDPLTEGKELVDRERRRRAEVLAAELRRRGESGGLAGAVPLRSE